MLYVTKAVGPGVMLVCGTPDATWQASSLRTPGRVRCWGTALTALVFAALLCGVLLSFLPAAAAACTQLADKLRDAFKERFGPACVELLLETDTSANAKRSMKERFGLRKVKADGQGLVKAALVPPVHLLQLDEAFRQGWIDYSALDAKVGLGGRLGVCWCCWSSEGNRGGCCGGASTCSPIVCPTHIPSRALRKDNQHSSSCPTAPAGRLWLQPQPVPAAAWKI